MAKKKIVKGANSTTIKKKPKMMDGGGTAIPGLQGLQQPQAPITSQDREDYNNYVSAMAHQPGRYVRNWNGNQDFQKEMAQKVGWGYNKNGAIQADMQSGTHAVSGVQKGASDYQNWGGDPNWMGSRESSKMYTKYEYLHYDKNGKLYDGTAGHLAPSTEPMTKDQMNSWVAAGTKNGNWQSNDQGIPMPTEQVQDPRLTPPVAQAPFVDKSQAIANRQMREADTTGKYTNMYEKGPAQDYSIDAVRSQNNDEVYGKGGKIHIKKSHEGKFTAYKKRTGKTTEEALHSKDPHVRQMANFARNASKWHHGDGGKIKPVVQEGFFPKNDPVDPQELIHNQRAIDSTDYSNLLQQNPAMAQWLYDQYNKVAKSNSSVAENAQRVIDSYNAATKAKAKGGYIKQYGTGDIIPGGMELPNPPTGTGPAGDGRWDPAQQAPPPVMPPAPAQGLPPQEPGPHSTPEDAPAPVGDDTTQNSSMPKKPKTLGIGVTLNTMPLIAGANMLVTQMYNSKMRANEANVMANKMRQVQSPNNFVGGDMLTYADGGMIDQFRMPLNQGAQKIEGGEGVQLPNGEFDIAEGDKHSNPITGGIDTDLPGGSKVYSKQLKAEKSFVSDITSGKIKKKMSIADLANKFSNEELEEKLAITKDPISKRSIQATMQSNDHMRDQIFAYQEDILKNPEATIKHDMMKKLAKGGQITMANGGIIMKKGGKITMMGEGDKVAYKKGFDQSIYDDQTKIWQEHPELVQEAYKQINPTTGKPYGAPASGIQDNIDGLDGPRYRFTKQYVDQHSQRPQDNIQPIEPAPLRPIEENPTGPRLEDGSFRSPWTPQTLPVPDLPDPVFDEDKDGTDKKSWIKRLASHVTTGNTAVPGWVPGAQAMINAMTDYPVHVGRMQPDYLGKLEGLNIDPILNRNLAVAKGQMSDNSGNASVDAARALGALSTVQEADNQAYAQKFNHDASQETFRRSKNVDIKNTADAYNLKAMDTTWDKMNQREANKRAAYQAIANNAYTNSRKALYEKNSKDIASEMFPNYDWKSGKGFSFVPDGEGGYKIVHEEPIAYNESDKDTKTTTSTTDDGKGHIKKKKTTREV